MNRIIDSIDVTFTQIADAIDDAVGSGTGTKRPVDARSVPLSAIPPALPPVEVGRTAGDLHLRVQQEWNAKAVEQNREYHEGAAAARDTTVPASLRLKGAMLAVRGLVARTYTDAKASASASVRSASFQRDVSLFLAEFGDLVRCGPTALLSCHEAYVMCDGDPVPVLVFVSTTHLCVSGHFLREAIPLAAVQSLQPSVCLATTELTPYFLPIPDPRVRPDALQVYTREGKVYQLHRVVRSARQALANAAVFESSPAEMLYAAVDRAWREAPRGGGGSGTAAPPAHPPRQTSQQQQPDDFDPVTKNTGTTQQPQQAAASSLDAEVSGNDGAKDESASDAAEGSV